MDLWLGLRSENGFKEFNEREEEKERKK